MNTTDEKVFSREEAEAIVEARLARERRNTEQLLPIREMIHRLRKREPYRSLSTAEISNLILRKIDSALKDTSSFSPSRTDGAEEETPNAETFAIQSESAEAEAEKSEKVPTEKTGEIPPENTTAALPEKAPETSETVLPETTASEKITPTKSDTVLQENGRDFAPSAEKPDDEPNRTEFDRAESDRTEFDRTEPDREEAAKERRREDIRAFLAEYGEETLLSALSDDAFKHFCVGKNGDLLTLYRGYITFLSALTESKNARLCRAAERQLASTGFSSGASGAPDYGALLTENQKSIAKASGMSYRDYARFLEQIPKKRL